MAKKVASAERIAYLCALHYLKAQSDEERQRVAELAGAIGKEIIGSESKFLERVISLCSEALVEAQKG